MLRKDNKVYSQKKYKLKEEVCKTTWSETIIDKNFPLPNLELTLGDKGAISTDDMFTSVGLVGCANYIQTGPKPNCDVYIDFDLQLVTFVANKNIEEKEELTYTLHPTCFNNVTIQ